MNWKADQEYYYFIYYPGRKETGLAKIKSIKTTDSMFPGVRITKIYTPDVWLGDMDRIKEGVPVSANELQGIGGSGPDAYIFENEQAVIKRIFEKVLAG